MSRKSELQVRFLVFWLLRENYNPVDSGNTFGIRRHLTAVRCLCCLNRQGENMDERYIFNVAQNEYAGTIHKMAALALQEGYKFILFNDQVYCISEDIIINTGLTRNDIFRYL